MEIPQTNTETFMKIEGSCVEHMDGVQKLPEKLTAADDATERKMLRSRIDEQSSLICMLKQRSDETLLRSQALQKINTELEARATHCQRELDGKRKKTETLERRFRDLAASNQSIIAFMEEHKKQNAQFRLENQQLKLENDSLFSQKLQDKEELVQKLRHDIKLLTEEYASKEVQYCQKLAEMESRHLEQAAQHKTKEASLLDQLQDAHQKHTNAVALCKDLRKTLQETKEQHGAKELSMTESLDNLTKEKDKLLHLSMERGKVIQDKQEEIEQLEAKWKEEKKARVKAQDRFENEADAVNKDAKVNSLQSALDESMKKIENLNKDLNALQEHSNLLLTQERELNKKLRHLIL
ncbi:coiled-coil domain-containing protein 89 [Salarias fasciatus]|uniref:coiled-coil domain-containing protein 89 n=1 Tax=Salarias fasciatus TaxID=181472 RepID=UPI001176B6D0|nr:coiled-coil domain-containing protein 89 [Salarias fasciatus]